MLMQNSAKEVVIINVISLSYRYTTVKCNVQILTQPKFHSFTEAKWTTVVKFVQHIPMTSYTVFLIDIHFTCLYSGGKGYPPKLTLSKGAEVS